MKSAKFYSGEGLAVSFLKYATLMKLMIVEFVIFNVVIEFWSSELLDLQKSVGVIW